MSLGETTITRATCGSRIRAIAHALPVTSNATQSRGSRLCANSSSASGRGWIRPAERSRPSATIATSQKSRCTSSASALTSSSSLSTTKGRTGGQTTSTDPRSRRNRASRRGGHRKARARSPSPKRPAQPAFSQKAPRPSRPNLDRRPDTTGPSREQFHAPTSRSAARGSPPGRRQERLTIGARRRFRFDCVEGSSGRQSCVAQVTCPGRRSMQQPM